MIVDRPAPKDFERQSIQYLIQSIDLITSNDHKDEDIEDYEVDMAECWKYHQGILNNSLTLSIGIKNFWDKVLGSHLIKG